MAMRFIKSNRCLAQLLVASPFSLIQSFSIATGTCSTQSAQERILKLRNGCNGCNEFPNLNTIGTSTSTSIGQRRPLQSFDRYWYTYQYRGSTRTVLSGERERRYRYSSEEKKCNQIKRNQTEEKLIANEEAARMRRLGQMKQRLQKSVSRENRIEVLEMKLKKAELLLESVSESEEASAEYMTVAERAELKGLLKVRGTFEEQYDPSKFTNEHLEFKADHNDALIALSHYCQNEWNRLKFGDGNAGQEPEPVNLFFLDGPDGGTASALINRGNFDARQCFVANRHEQSCKALKEILPDENVAYATASEALTTSTPCFVDSLDSGNSLLEDLVLESSSREDGVFGNMEFAAYYFDGCGGFVPHITGMMAAALLRQDCDASKPIAIGYSLLGGNKNVVDKELSVSQSLSIIARRRKMRMVHVLDDPLRYGIRPDIKKIGGSAGGTFTTWHLLLPDQ